MRWIALSLLLAAGLAAPAAGMPKLTDLEDALEIRLAALTPPATKAGAKEAKALAKALDYVNRAFEAAEDLVGPEDLKDLTFVTLLAKAAAIVEKSGTEDPAVLWALDAISFHLEGRWSSLAGIVTGYEYQLTEQQIDRIEAGLGKAEEYEQQAAGYWSEGAWGKSTKVSLKLSKLYLKAWKKCAKWTGIAVPKL